MISKIARWLGGAFLAQLASRAFKSTMAWLADRVRKNKGTG